MMDDIDREVCSSIEKIIQNAFKDNDTFNVESIKLNDPGYTIVVSADGYYNKVYSTINIEWGKDEK